MRSSRADAVRLFTLHNAKLSNRREIQQLLMQGNFEQLRIPLKHGRRRTAVPVTPICQTESVVNPFTVHFGIVGS